MSVESQIVQDSDHRRIGQKLGLFRIDTETGKGLPLWLPNGTVVRDELEKLARELEFKAGFERVVTPHIARVALYEQSGHLPYFREDMYPFMDVVEADADGGTVKDSYVLRPMNCPHHHRVFAAEPRSYRDLPLRLAEYGQVYRWERSGALSGLARVRGMCMNDGHIYCTKAQVRAELAAVLDMYREVYAQLGITDYRFRLSRRSAEDARQKYVDDDAAWIWSEALLGELLRERGVDYEDGIGHAAFYGPKIDVQVRTRSGVEETLSTVQLDFAQPARLGLRYVSAAGESATPYCIHRAPFSTHERFVAFLTELYGGAFPLWLAPVQAVVIPVSDRFRAYGEQVADALRHELIRARLAPEGETVAKNVRAAAGLAVPILLVVGEREAAAGTVTLRVRGSRAQRSLVLERFMQALQDSLRRRSSELELDGLAAAAGT